jgi:predicted 3-demethylubiquinone-9 3-methyltransferase (glyoxalase superfamily)
MTQSRYGLSWQVTPGGMDQLFADPDRSRAEHGCPFRGLLFVSQATNHHERNPE